MTTRLQKTCRLNTRQLCQRLDLCVSTLRRWRDRAARGLPLLQRPGPKKPGPLPFEELRRQMTALVHGRKRTHGSSALYQRHQCSISRRDLRKLVAEQRRVTHQTQRHNYHRIEWHQPNLAWAIDATEYGRDQSGRKLFLVAITDLGSRFTFQPLASLNPTGVQIADHLRALFHLHGRPLLLKRDNGSIFNHHDVDALLGERGVIPLNSPPYYPRYNGAIEKSIRELKVTFHDCLPQPPAQWVLADAARIAAAAAHLRNCAPRRCLGGLSAAEAWQQLPRTRFSSADRLRTFRWITDRVDAILRSLDRPTSHDFRAAWRQTIQSYLATYRFITIHINQPLLPHFDLSLLP